MKQVIMTSYNCNLIFLNVFSLNNNDAGQSDNFTRAFMFINDKHFFLTQDPL